MYTKILAAHEQLGDAIHALDKAAALAATFQAELFVLGILEPGPGAVLTFGQLPPVNLAHSPDFIRLHARAEAWAKQQKIRPRLETHVGSAIHLIERFAEEFGADLLVLGDVGDRGAWGPLLEHSAERLSLRAACDVLVVR